MDMQAATEMGQRRLLLASTEYVQPLLEHRKQIAIALMMGKFRDGSKDFINEVAILVALDDLQMELRKNETALNNNSKETAK